MTKYQPPRKGKGKKKVAPKKAVRSKPIPQQVAEKSTSRCIELKSRQQGRTAAAGLAVSPGYDRAKALAEGRLPCASCCRHSVKNGEIHWKEAEKLCALLKAEGAPDHVADATIEEGRICGTAKPVWGDEHSFGVVALDPRPADDPYKPPAPKPPGPLSKFWRQYQDESGQFVGFAKALTKTKDQVISRLRLRKPAR